MTELKPLKNLFATDNIPVGYKLLFKSLEATDEQAATILPVAGSENYPCYYDYVRKVNIWSAAASLRSLIKANGLDPDKDWWVVRGNDLK